MPARCKQSKRSKNSYEKGTNNVICDRTGFKRKANQCRFEWNNLFVLNDWWEERQPQDFLRGFPDRQQPEVSRPGTSDVYVLPGEVTAEDL